MDQLSHAPPPLPDTGSKPRLVFLHIPKTAGTSFLTTLGNVFGESHVRRLPWDAFSREGLQQLRDQPGWAEIDCLAGHFPVHAVAGWGAEFSLFTLLRHPVDRVFSLFRFLRRQSPAELARMGLAPGFGFEAFLDCETAEVFAQLRNGMCRLLCGLPEMSDEADPAFWRADREAEMAERSLALLDTVPFGLAERMPETLHLLGELMQARQPLSEHVENISGPPGPEWTTGNIVRVVALNGGDLAMYHQAARLFGQRIARTGALPRVEHAAFALPLGAEVPLCEIPGRHGFHAYEPGLGFAWVMGTGPAAIDFGTTPGRRTLSLSLYRMADSYPVEQVTLEVNGHEVSHRWTPTDAGWGILESAPFEALAVNRLGLGAPYAVPARFIAPHSGDERVLSVALATLTLHPA